MPMPSPSYGHLRSAHFSPTWTASVHRAGRYLRQAKLPLLVYDDAEAVVPELFLWGLLDKLAHQEGIEDVGLLAATYTPLWQSEPKLIGLLQSLPTLWIALTTFCRVTRQFSTADQFGIVREGNYALLQRSQRPDIAGEDQAELYDLKLMIQLVQLAGGRDWVPPEVLVSEVNARRLSLSKEFERVRILRSDTLTCVVLPTDMLALSMNALARPCGLQLPNPLADNFLESLSAVIGTYLQDGNMNIQLAAEMAGLSKRTFQRRLGDLQLDYNTLIDQVRLKQALSLLIKPDVTVTEIAYHLGYSAPAHFTRAFRRWTALSPREYRRQHQLV
ncbi:MAG: helix-turn-helix transcriptional regulator [Porticoccus sp.]|nr:helix-turn-helix transcriptional regulator [Porticoccus sp.]